MSIVEEIRFKNFEDFYQVMGPEGSLFSKLKGFIFRGQSDYSYKLCPSILRYNHDGPFKISELSCMAKMKRDACIRAADFELENVFLEYSLLLHFYKIANYSGLHVPCINNFIFSANTSFLMHKMKEGGFTWIHKDIVELAALAQHYGIPTRLLDWSFDIYVALYFAVQGACRHIDEGKGEGRYFELWAINHREFDKIDGIPLKFIIPSYSNNENLCAQKGILSYFEKRLDEIVQFEGTKRIPINRDTRPLDELLEEYKDIFTKKMLYRIIFPYTCAKSAFYFLNKLGYHASKIFPGYKGVVLEMEEKKYIYD